jgi:hypothetical protein
LTAAVPKSKFPCVPFYRRLDDGTALVDRNPQTFMDIDKAKASDFQLAWMRIYREPGRESKIIAGILD